MSQYQEDPENPEPLSPREHARVGEYHLEKAVIGVLFETRSEGKCVGATEIGWRAGIFCEAGPGCFGNAIVAGVLCKMHAQGRIRRCKQSSARNGWELAD